MATLQPSNAIPLTQLAILHANWASYTLVGSFTSAIEMMIITSTLDQPVQLSFDGTNDHIAVPAGSTTPVIFPINFKNNRMVFSNPTVFVKNIGTPTAGNLFISGFSAAIP